MTTDITIEGFGTFKDCGPTKCENCGKQVTHSYQTWDERFLGSECIREAYGISTTIKRVKA
jgi:hypothetical protein